MNIGKSIKSVRKVLGISQEQLCKKVGLSQPALSQFENGVNNPNEKAVKKISKALGVSSGLLYILAIDETDVPKSKKAMFDSLYPHIKSLAFDLVLTDEQRIRLKKLVTFENNS